MMSSASLERRALQERHAAAAAPALCAMQGVDALLRRVSALLQSSMVEVHCLIPYKQVGLTSVAASIWLSV